MVLELDDLLAVAELISLDAELLKYRQVDIAGRFTFANNMSTVVIEFPACDKHWDFIPIMRSHSLAHAVIARCEGDCLIHQRAAGIDFRTGKFSKKVG